VKRGRGRPLLPEGERVSEVISVHLTQDLADKVYRVAYHSQQSAGAIIRTALLRFFASSNNQ